MLLVFVSIGSRIRELFMIMIKKMKVHFVGVIVLRVKFVIFYHFLRVKRVLFRILGFGLEVFVNFVCFKRVL